MEQRRLWLCPCKLEQRDGTSGSIGNVSVAALAAMVQWQLQTHGAAMAMAQQLQQWFQMMTRMSSSIIENTQKGIA
jgi:hypothetical protein